MTESFSGKNLLIVGGAGFVGSNLVRLILTERPRKLTVVDNLLSADPVNVPHDPALKLVSGSITDERILRELDDDLDYVYPPRLLSRQPIVDSRSVGGSRQQHLDDAETVRAVERYQVAEEGRLFGGGLRSRREDVRRCPQRPKKRPSLCFTTAHIRSPS